MSRVGCDFTSVSVKELLGVEASKMYGEAVWAILHGAGGAVQVMQCASHNPALLSTTAMHPHLVCLNEEGDGPVGVDPAGVVNGGMVCSAHACLPTAGGAPHAFIQLCSPTSLCLHCTVAVTALHCNQTRQSPDAWTHWYMSLSAFLKFWNADAFCRGSRAGTRAFLEPCTCAGWAGTCVKHQITRTLHPMRLAPMPFPMHAAQFM